MIIFERIGSFFEIVASMATDPMSLAILFGSVLLGILFGAMPGLTSTLGVALLTALTYSMNTEMAMICLLAIYVGGTYGGSYASILINIPGTAAAAATAMDGYPLAIKGEGGRAIGLTTTASAIGTVNTAEGTGFSFAEATSTDITPQFGDGTTADEYGSVVVAADSTVQEAADAINAGNVTGVSAFVNSSNELQVINTSGNEITFTEAGATGGDTLGITGEVTADEAVGATTTLDGVGIDTVAGANFAIARVDSALTAVNGLRGNLGAIQNRFESTIVNLQTVSENLAASRGRIQDADFAAETANLTKAQILQQAGVSVLSQANAQPQLALSLLQ